MTIAHTSRLPTRTLSHIVGPCVSIAARGDNSEPQFCNTTRFTLNGHDVLEAELAATCEKVAAGLQSIVPAPLVDGLVLAGGYGRGEGGVMMTPGGERPYNDLEFYFFLKGSPRWLERQFGVAIKEMCLRLGETAGLDVEVKIDSLSRLRSSPISMFSYDLCTMHRLVLGGPEMFYGCVHHLDATAIPLHEATRLLFNRCSGLLFAAERLKRTTFTADDSDFVVRNLAKLQMAMGDAILASVGYYHWSCRERGHRMSDLMSNWEMALPKWASRIKMFMEALFKNHSEGIAFKLHPHRDQLARHSREALLQRYGLLKWIAGEVWLALENRRLEQNFANPKAYAMSEVNKCPEKPVWRNALINAWSFGEWSCCLIYPRQRLFQALVLMLWGDCSKSDQLDVIQRELRTKAVDFSDLVAAYEDIWVRFN